MKKLAVLTVIGLTITMINCSPKKTATPATTTAALTKETAQKQYTADQLSSGQQLYASSCGTCHKLFKTDAFTDVKWHGILNRMIPKADVSAADAALIRAYVIANSAVAAK